MVELVFFANYLFYQDVGYFDNSAETKPVLHLWSLGVEEQFYIMWPLIIYILYKRNINIFTFSIILFTASFLLNIKTSRDDISLDFYSVFTRFWELTAGSILSLVYVYRANSLESFKSSFGSYISSIIFNKKTKNDKLVFETTASIIGASILFYGITHINNKFSFPGFWASLPVFGSMLIILAGRDAFFNKLILSNKIFVWFGLISFPLYLWHWPLLSFARIINESEVTIPCRILIIFISILFSWITYIGIERPLRSKQYTRGQFISLVSIMALIGFFGLVNFETDGTIARLAFQEKRAAIAHTNSAVFAPQEGYDNCKKVFPQWDKNTDSHCFIQKAQGSNTVAIVGDSHAVHLLPGLIRKLPPSEGVVLFPASCAAPFIDVATATRERAVQNIRKDAYKLIDSAYDYIINDKNIKTVILSHLPKCSYSDAIDIENPNITDPSIVMENGFRRTIQKLEQANKKIIIVLDNPFLPYNPTACVGRNIVMLKNGDKCSFPRQMWENIPAYNWYKNIVETSSTSNNNIYYYDTSKYLCDNKYCYISKNGNILYKDTNHLSLYGSLYIADGLVKIIENGRGD
ncbi:UNVERIFIED_CONTAM: acyltransferase-like protein [Acetobacter peroxydans]